MTQREGRILRQGNVNQEVKIFRYITEGSFDAYSWQLLETKQRFISNLLSGSVSERSGSDIENTVLNYAEIKALAVGNPAVKRRIEKANELSKYISLRNRTVETIQQLDTELNDLPVKIKEQELLIAKCKIDIKLYENSYQELDQESREEYREELYSLISDNVLKNKEREAFKYQGFSIMLPAKMMKEKPFIYIKGNGKYYVELSGSKTGCLIRVDNFLNGLTGYLTKCEDNLARLYDRKMAIEISLEEQVDYTDKIKQLEEELKSIDFQLGVNRK